MRSDGATKIIEKLETDSVFETVESLSLTLIIHKLSKLQLKIKYPNLAQIIPPEKIKQRPISIMKMEIIISEHLN